MGTDRCIALPDEDAGSQSMMASCSGSDGVLTYYVANDCTGTVAQTDDTSENSCETIETCSTAAPSASPTMEPASPTMAPTLGGSSSASLPAALLAMVVSAIALIA